MQLMQSCRLTLAVVLATITVTVSGPSAPALAQSGGHDDPALSSYWDPAVNQWEPIILQYAQERNLDPDLIASVIWKESLGRAWERGPVGAVGLMGLMPFEWRPSTEELHNPWTNVAWGARALAHTIRDGRGDLFYALAAYNGGWDQIHLRVTRRYAADVLNHYARAVAVRHGLPADGDWVAIFAVEGAPPPNTTTVIGPQRPLTRYTERPYGQAGIPMAPFDLPPHATAITFVNKQGARCRVNVWLIAENGPPHIPSALQTSFVSSPVDGVRNGRYIVSPSYPSKTSNTPLLQPAIPTDVPVATPVAEAVVLAGGAELRPGASAWWNPRLTLPAGTELELIGYDPDFPDWVYVRTVDGTSTGWVQTADIELNRELSKLPPVTPIPTLTPSPTPTLTPTIPVATTTPTPPPTPTSTPTTTPVTPTTPSTTTLPTECEGGPLRLEAWPLERFHSPEGWTATIFVQAYGGDCMYTYAWQGEVKGGPMPGPLTFQVNHVDRTAPIVGTVSATSAGETVEVGLFIRTPSDD